MASLFTPGGTHAIKGEFAGINDFEVLAFLIVLSADTARATFDQRYERFLGAIEGLPEDLADQHDHYRLGTPKR